MEKDTKMNKAQYARYQRNVDLIAEAKDGVIPEVGMGATMATGSDSYPYTVVKVAEDLSSIEITADSHHPAPGFDYYSNQVYTYTSNPGPGTVLTLNTRGKLRGLYGNGRIYLGNRRYYQDPSF